MPHHDDRPDDGPPIDDPARVETMLAEMERVIGPIDVDADPFKVEFLLPITSDDELIALLRALPTGLGVPGLLRVINERFGSSSMLAYRETPAPD